MSKILKGAKPTQGRMGKEEGGRGKLLGHWKCQYPRESSWAMEWSFRKRNLNTQKETSEGIIREVAVEQRLNSSPCPTTMNERSIGTRYGIVAFREVDTVEKFTQPQNAKTQFTQKLRMGIPLGILWCLMPLKIIRKYFQIPSHLEFWPYWTTNQVKKKKQERY